MVRYSSRVNTKPRKTKIAKKQKPEMSTTGDQPSEKILVSDPVSADVVASVLPDLGASLQTGGVLGSGGSLQVGGALGSGGSLQTGGALGSGGALEKKEKINEILQPDDIDNMSIQEMIHTLGSMDMQTYHTLQGLAAAHLNHPHPLATGLKLGLGGSFIHPKNISKLATKDILKANTPQQLSRSLHSEFMDMKRGMDVGGGLFSSLKMLVKRGVAGSRQALSALGEGAKKAVKGLSSGVSTAGMVGKSLSNAIKQGIQIANVISPALSQLSPAAGELLQRGVGAAEQAQKLAERGVQVSQLSQEVLLPLLGAIDAPLVSLP